MRIMLTGIFVLLLCAEGASAEPWKLEADVNLTLNQNAYSDNWVGGEAGSISWALNSNWLAERQLNAKLHSKSTLKLLFGQTHMQDVETDDWAKPVKSTDLIDLESVLRFTLGAFVDPYAGVRVESQFLDQSDPGLDRYVNPVKFTESAGIAKVFIKEEKREWSARLGAGVRQYLNRDVLNIVTDERETLTSNDGGLVFDSEFKTPLASDRISLQSKLTVFKAFIYSEKDEIAGLPNEDYWKAPDVNWENIFTAGITEHLMVNLYIQLLYDKEIDLAGRFKQTLALGVTYKLL
ncbi:MAG TPA: DUF3078 domain-containing protein [Candidatus Eisenbacteria bacterium]|uniref:DUF3078 domain-containing protein n=1 Tax=Eiseniibacteriota bacterium TaxID=2212470 RepID=A0A7V2F3P3_UNCEI|nr:DUF3078 domain-containing protein [Candidatus Eisenbacteria bacterium]